MRDKEDGIVYDEVNKKGDAHAKTNTKESFEHKCLEVHKHRVETWENWQHIMPSGNCVAILQGYR